MPLMFLESPPKPVGYWCIGGPRGFRFGIATRPRWLTRVMARLLLEWEWRDEV